MQVITRMEPFLSVSKVSIALGTFDGIHLGHQKVIGRAVEFARKTDGISAVFTFENHPLSVLNPGQCPPLITSLADKERLIADIGIDLLYCIPFDSDLLRLSPTEFIDRLLSLVTASHIVVGPNYSFGFHGLGTPELLHAIGQAKGFAVEVQEAVYVDSQMISSTSIRQAILQGAVDQAAKLLGRPFQLSGEVVHGDKRGRTIGFPTANLLVTAQVIPADGVYAVYALCNGERRPALANIGNNPTFANQSRRIEIHVLDFDANLYGQVLSVDFYKKLRDESTFPGIQELKQRIALDVVEARHFFAVNS